MTEQTEKEVLGEILSGKYRDYYLPYNRKSTDDAESQKNSINYQKRKNLEFCRKEKLKIAPITLDGFCKDGIISERHSAFKEDATLTFTKDGLVQYRIERPKFLKLVQFLSKGLFKGVVFLSWDRASRNKGDDTIIGKLMKRGVDIRFSLATYDKTSSGELHSDIDGTFAAHHSRVTSEKVRLNIKTLREKGVCTYRAPIGYLNQGKMEEKPFDPEREPIISEMFKLCATGDWSLSDLAVWANKEGLTTVPMRRRRTEEEMLAEEEEDKDGKTENKIPKVSRPITTNQVHKILTNRFYSGHILGNDKKYVKSASHKELVSPEIFREVQEELKKRRISVRYAEKIPYFHRGVVRCGSCGRVYTPYKKKGIQYFGARCQIGCLNQRKSFNLPFLEKKVGELVSGLYFVEEELVEMDATLKTDIAVFEEKRLRELEQNDRKKKKIREDLNYLRTNKLTLLKSSVYSPEDLLDEETKLNNELFDLQSKEQASDASMHEVMKDIIKLSELVRYGSDTYHFANHAEKEKLRGIIFSELALYGDKNEDTLIPKYKKVFQFLANRPSFRGNVESALTGNRTPVPALRRLCPSR